MIDSRKWVWGYRIPISKAGACLPEAAFCGVTGEALRVKVGRLNERRLV